MPRDAKESYKNVSNHTIEKETALTILFLSGNVFILSSVLKIALLRYNAHTIQCTH